jgi:HEAT repeat protein
MSGMKALCSLLLACVAGSGLANAEEKNPLAEKSVPDLASILIQSKDEALRLNASKALAAKPLAELTKIIRESPDAEVRYHAVRAAATKGEEATPLLIETLQDKSPGVGYGAAQSLGERGETSLDLALGLLKHKDKQQRTLGTIMLKHIGKKASPAVTVPALLKSLKDEHFDVRMNAANALAVLGDSAEAAVPALIEAASDEEWWVRREACMALATINTPEVRRAMIDIVTTERHAALGWQDKSVFMKQVTSDPELQDELAQAYGKWLLKKKGYINTFAARGTFGSGVKGLERLVKEKRPIPDEVAKTIRRVLEDKESALWPVDERARKKLEAILESLGAAKGAK